MLAICICYISLHRHRAAIILPWRLAISARDAFYVRQNLRHDRLGVKGLEFDLGLSSG